MIEVGIEWLDGTYITVSGEEYRYLGDCLEITIESDKFKEIVPLYYIRRLFITQISNTGEELGG